MIVIGRLEVGPHTIANLSWDHFELPLHIALVGFFTCIELNRPQDAPCISCKIYFARYRNNFSAETAVRQWWQIKFGWLSRIVLNTGRLVSKHRLFRVTGKHLTTSHLKKKRHAKYFSRCETFPIFRK